MNEHYNKRLKKWRYKKIKINNQKLIGTVMYGSNMQYYQEIYENSTKFAYIRYDYKFHKFLNIWWNFIDWYKRPRSKDIPAKPILSIMFKFISKFIIQFIIAFIITVFLFVYGDDIMVYLKTYT
jgi:hypothetical protein